MRSVIKRKANFAILLVSTFHGYLRFIYAQLEYLFLHAQRYSTTIIYLLKLYSFFIN